MQKDTSWMFPSLVALIVGLIVFLVLCWEIDQRHIAERAQRELVQTTKWIEETFKFQQGWSQGYGEFNLVSFDQGKTWYDRKKQPDGKVLLVDATELGHQQTALDAIAKMGRSLDPTDSTDRKLLEDAGFKIEISTDVPKARTKP